MKRVISSILVLAASFGAAFADTPDALVEYIESNGSQYIDTGIEACADTKAEFKMRWTDTPGTDWMFLGARANNNNNRFYYLYTYRQRFYYGFGSVKGYAGNFSPSVGTDYAFSVELTSGRQWNATVSGGSSGTYNYDCSASTESLNSGINIYAFACNNNGAGVVMQSKARCYYIRIWKGGALVRDFVPCVKNGRAGLYDRVSQGIFYSQGSADFSAEGAGTIAVRGTPDSNLEYVEATGSQYIDTGVVGKDGTKAEMELVLTDLSGGDVGHVMLGSSSGSSTNMFYMPWFRTYNSYYRAMTGYNARYQYFYRAQGTSAIYTYTRYSISGEVTTTSQYNTMLNGFEQPYDYSANGPVDTGYTMYAFAANDSGTAAKYTRAKLYAMKIWQTDSNGDYQPVRDYAPCMKDGRAGLYDSVSGMVFFGQGADLVAPPVTDTPPDAFVEYVESTGSQYIDTGVTARYGTKAEMRLAMNADTANSVSRTCLLAAWGSGSGNDRKIEFCWSGKSSATSRNVGAYFCGVQTYWWGDVDPSVYTFSSELTTNNQSIVYHGGRNASSTKNVSVANADIGVNLYAFACNDNGTADQFCKAKLYSMKIWQVPDGGTGYELVRDFRPCIKDGVAGLYDGVSKTIFYSQTKNLVAGPESGAAPAKFVEYVESDGTQYVDTGVMGKAGVKAAMTFNANANNGNPAYLLSSYGNDVNMNFCYFGQKINVGFGGSTWNTTWSYSKGTQYTLTSGYTLAQKVNASLNGSVAGEKTAFGGTDSGVNLYAFARNNGGTPDGKCSVKLYSMKIWQAVDAGDYALVRDFRPCVATNGVAALYDKVSGAIFYPQGGSLATGGVERAVAVTARWKGGAVAEEADLSAAGNWDCYDADGNVLAGATPSAATTVLVGQGSPLLALPSGIAVQEWAGVTLTNSVTLGAAGDWSALGLMTLASGVTVDLNGHDLVSGGFAVADGGAATVDNSGAAVNLTFDVADGNTATINGIAFAINIALAKTGEGTLGTASGYNLGNGRSSTFALDGGRYVSSGNSFVIGRNGGVGSLAQTGGTLDVTGYLTMGYQNGAYGTYTMTGGNLIVRNQPMIVCQAATAPQPSTFDLSGTGVATLMNGIRLSVDANGGASVVNVHDGGRIRTSSIIKGTSANANPTLTFDGGILEPLGNVEGLLDGMPLTIGEKGFIVDTAGHNVTLGDFSLTSPGGELVKVGAGALTITNAPALGTLTVSNGTLAVTTAMSGLDAVCVEAGAVLDLGGNALMCGTFSGAGEVTNGTLTVTGELCVALGNPPTLIDVSLDIDGARIDVAGSESITGRDPIVVLTSNMPITGRPQRSNVSGRRWQVSQDGDVYKLELVPQGGFQFFIR